MGCDALYPENVPQGIGDSFAVISLCTEKRCGAHFIVRQLIFKPQYLIEKLFSQREQGFYALGKGLPFLNQAAFCGSAQTIPCSYGLRLCSEGACVDRTDVDFGNVSQTRDHLGSFVDKSVGVYIGKTTDIAFRVGGGSFT